MDSKNVGGDGDATGGLSNAPTLDQVYAAIMSQKRKAQEPPPVPVTAPEPVLRLRSGVGASVRNNTLEQLLLQGLTGGQEDGHLSIMRSNTMDILRETLSGARELQDLLVEWNHSMPEEKFVEGLASDMQAIDAAPPDVHTMRRTFTLERILSGAESDLAGMLRANHQQQHLQQVVRQQSGAAGAAAAATADMPGEGSGPTVRLGPGGSAVGRSTERLQRQESLHRLASASGPNQQPRPLSTSSGMMGTTHAHSRTAAGALCSGSGGGGGGSGSASGLLRASHGSERYGTAAAAALSAEDECPQPRSPKRHKLHHLKVGDAPSGSAPERTWSQSLLDLAKAAAALDGRDLDEDDAGGRGGSGGEGDKRGVRISDISGGEERHHAQQPRHHHHQQQHHHHQQQQQYHHHHHQQQQQQHRQGIEAAGGDQHGSYAAAISERRMDVCAAIIQAEEADGDRERRVIVGSGRGVSAATEETAVPVTVSAVQLLRSLSGLKAVSASVSGGHQGHQRGGGGVVAAEMQQPNSHDSKLLLKLHAEVERLQRDNEGLNGQLEAVLAQVDIIQQKNAAMKQLLLEACHAKGIHADMELLNVSLQHHRTQPMGEAQATHVAATVLGLNGGDVLATVQHLIGIALLRITEGQGHGQNLHHLQHQGHG